MKNNNSRRFFLKSSLSLGVLGSLAPWLGQLRTTDEDNSNIKLTNESVNGLSVNSTPPYLQSHFDNEMQVSWISEQDSAVYVRYGKSPDNLALMAYPKTILGLQNANHRLHHVHFRNLEPGSIYYYQTITKPITEFKPYALKYGQPIESSIYSFKNLDPKANSFEFFMLNDIHDRPNSILHLMQLRPQSSPDFVVFNGDIFDYQTDENQLINHFISPCTDTFAKSKPFLFLRGNHETRGKFARQFPTYFKEVGYAAFSIGPARIILLDTGEDKVDSHPVYAGIVDFDRYREEQASLLAQEIKSSEFKKAKFKIVIMHIPPRFSGDWHGPLECTRLFEPLLNKGKVDLVLSGHTHEFKIHHSGESTNLYNLVIGGGPKDGERTLTSVQVNANKLQVKVFNDLGIEIGSLQLDS